MRLSSLLRYYRGIYRQRHGYILALNIKPMSSVANQSCVETNMFNALIHTTINGIGVISNVEVKHEYWRCREANWTVIKVDSFV